MSASNLLDVAGSLFGQDVALDLGTANTVAYVRGEGIVLDEPSVVAINTNSRRVVAVGAEAKSMLGRTPSRIQAVRPLKDGVIADFDRCEEMLSHFISRVRRRRWAKPRVVIAVPSGITGVEQRAVQEVAESAGARRPTSTIEEPMAAAIGTGMRVWEPTGNMIVDVGGGTTEVAVISLGGIVASKSIRVGGDEFDNAVMQFVKKQHGLLIGASTAENIKIKLGSAGPLTQELVADVRGRDMVTGLPMVASVNTAEVRDGLAEAVAAICDAVRATLDRTPPELAADIMERGIMLAGGGAMLRNLDQRLANETGMPVTLVKDPLSAVVRGAGIYLDSMDNMGDAALKPGTG